MKRSVQKKTKVKKQKNNLYVLVALILLTISGVFTAAYFQYSKERSNSSARAASSGWLSGASCHGITDGSFESWRGSPMTIAGTWNDGSLDYQQRQPNIGGEYGQWSGSLDASIGGFWGSDWANAANGGDDDNWRQALRNIDAGWGNKKTIFIRYAHEFNGDWYQWKVKPADNENYKKAFQRFYGMVQSELVAKGRDAKVVWPPNSDDHNGIKATDSWPGDQYVDVVGVDFYDWDRNRDQSTWDQNFMKTGSYGGPAGVGSWQAFAKAHGKPISFPEWGTTGDGPYDDPFFIQKMNEFFRANAGTGPGQVWYEIYFNCTGYNNGGGENFQIYPNTTVPQTASMYKSLKWGDGGLVVTSPTLQTNASPTPTAPFPTATTYLISPTLYCAGSGYCVPSQNPSPTEDGQVSPTSDITQGPNPSDQPNDTVTQAPNGNGGGNHGRGNGGGRSQGILQIIMQFISMLLALLMKLFGR